MKVGSDHIISNMLITWKTLFQTSYKYETTFLHANRLTELRFNVPLDTKQVVLEIGFLANIFASTEKNIKTTRNNYRKFTINVGKNKDKNYKKITTYLQCKKRQHK